MNRTVEWVAAMLALIVLPVFVLVVSTNLLPSVAEANERGVFGPLVFIWLLILMAVGSAVALVVYLVRLAMGRPA